MTRLADALGLRFSGVDALEARCNGAVVWSAPSAAATSSWGATSVYGEIVGNVVRALQPGAINEAAFTVGDRPLTGKVYFEADICSDLEGVATTTGVGVSTYTGGPIPTHGIGTLETELDIGSNADAAFGYVNGSQIFSAAAHLYQGPAIFRFGFHVDADARSVWVHQIYAGGTRQMLLGGDPVAGTDPTFICPGTDPLYIAASVRGDSSAYAQIYTDPADFVESPMTGYAPIAAAPKLALSGGMVQGAMGATSGAGYVVSNGVAPYTFIYAGDAVPGITFNADGTRSGVYSALGSYTRYTTVVDAEGKVAQLREQIEVSAAEGDPQLVVTTANAAVTNGSRTLAHNGGAGTLAHALTAVPLSGKQYLEVELTMGSSGSVVASLYGGDAPLSTEFQLGQWDGQPGATIGFADQWSMQLRANAGLAGSVQEGSFRLLGGGQPQTQVVCLAVDADTRAVWAFTAGDPTPFGGGNPATGEAPSFVLAGSGPIFVGAASGGVDRVATLRLSSEHSLAAPEGFTNYMPAE